MNRLRSLSVAPAFTRPTSTGIAVLSVWLCAACAIDPSPGDEPDESTALQASTPIQDVNAAETAFRSAVTQGVVSSASAAGISLGSTGVRLAHVPRARTIGASTTTRGTQALFLSRSVARPSGTFQPGLYELTSGSRGPIYYYPPSGGRLTIADPGSGPVGFHTPLGNDLCGDPDWDFCQQFVACWAYDLFCW